MYRLHDNKQKTLHPIYNKADTFIQQNQNKKV